MFKQLSLIIFTILLLLPAGLKAQDILTAENFFDTLSESYGKIQDYEAGIIITRDETVMKGMLYYKNPNLLRIDFTEPEEQVLATDGKLLTIYIPKYEVIMEQKLKRRSQAAVASMASEQGLHILKKNYSISYLKSPDKLPLEEGSSEMVVQLKLDSRSTAEGFRQIVISIGSNGLIRRITGVTLGYDELIFDFTDVKINQNIPEVRFNYDSPPYANVYRNFLFEPEE